MRGVIQIAKNFLFAAIFLLCAGNILAADWDGRLNDWQSTPTTDWSQAQGWTPVGVPTSTVNANIPGAQNPPDNFVVVTATSNCQNLSITNNMSLRVVNGGANLTVSGNISVANGSMLVVGNGASVTLYCSGSMNNNGTFSYNIGGGDSGTVSFTGTSQTIDMDGSGGTGTGSFYNLTISGSYTLQSDVTVDNNLTVSGTLNLNGYTLTVGGNTTISGTVNVGSGTLDVQGDLTINAGGTLNNNTGTVKVGGSVSNSGTYNYNTGTFIYTGSSQTLVALSYYNLQISGSVTSVTSTPNIYSSLTVLSGGSLSLGSSTIAFDNGASFTVNSGGTFSSSGGTLQSQAASEYFSLTINGTINVDGLTVNRPDNNGLTINSTASVAQLRGVTFQNGQNGTGNRYLYIGHSSGSFTFENHSFDAYCSTNVTAPNGALISMVNATGAHSGESYDGTIDGNITWTTANTWQGDDATNPTLWSVAENWSKGTVPVANDVVIIPDVTNDPVLDVDGVCASLRIQNGGNLTLSTANTTLDVGGAVTIESGGTLTLNNATTRLKVGGTWSNSGTFTATNGEVIFSSTLIDQDIPSETFDDLTIDKSSTTATATGNITVNGNFKVSSGTFDAGGYTHTVSGTTDIYGIVKLPSGSDFTARGALTVKEGGQLQLIDACTLRLETSLTVDSGTTNGKFYAGGSSGTPTVTWYNSTRYSFTVNGDIRVEKLTFDYPDSNGLTINNGAGIDELENITFTNGLATGTYLRILDLSSSSYFVSGCDFDANCQYNVAAASGTSVTINMVNATGAHVGETYDNDPGEPGSDNIVWYTEKLWDGQGSGGWGVTPNRYNWSNTDGWTPSGLPTSSDMVRFPSTAPTSCTVDISGAVAGGVRIEKELKITSSGNALDVGDYFIIESSGTYTMTNGTLYVGGNWTNKGSTGITGGTVVFDGTTIVDKDVGSAGEQVFYNLTVSGTMTITDNDSVTVNGTFTPTNATINAGDGTTLTTTGTWGGLPTTFNYETSTVVLKGTTTVPTVTYYNLTIDGTATLGGNVTVKNNLTINSGASLNLSSYTITVEGNVDNQGTLDLDTGTLKVAGTFTSSGTFTADSGTVEFNGTTQTAPALTYYNLTVNGSTVSLGGNITVNNQLNVTSGELSIGSNTITFANGAALDVDGKFSSSGGTLQSSGAGNYFGINIDGTINVDGLTISYPNDNGLTIQSTATIESLDNVTFQNGQNGASSRYLWIGHSSGTYTFVSHSIDSNSTYNVVAPNGVLIYMVSATGTGAGESKDGAIDANIIWTTANTWQGDDATNPTLWSVAENWSAGHVPTSTEYALIPNVANQPTLDTNGTCGGIKIENGATLTMNTASTTLDVNGSLTISSGGTLTMSSSTTELKLSGSWTDNGTFNANAGTVTFDNTSGSQTIPAETFYNLKIDKSSATASLGGNVFVTGNLTLSSGTLSVGANNLQVSGTGSITGTLELTDSSDVKFNGALTVNSGGEISMQGACYLRLGNSLTVNSGGTFSASGSTPTVTWNSVNRYSFTVSGEINVNGLIIDYPDTNGLTINSGATLTDLDSVQFTNGSLSSGTYLRILLSDSSTYYLDSHDFDNNCQYNVYVPSANSVTINMVGATGAKAGESYDNDSGNHVNWLTQKIWYGTSDSLWNTSSNWSGNSVPVSSDNVLIKSAPNICNVNISGAVAQSIRIENSATLRVANASTNSLTVSGYINIESGGILVLRNDAQLTVGGDWTDNGTFTLESGTTSGTVVFNNSTTVDKNTSGAGTETFDNLTVSGTMTIADGDSVTVTGTFNPSGTINAGNSTTLTTTGNWSSTPSAFNRGTSTVVLKGTVNVPSVTYYNLTIDGTATLTSNITVENDLVINSGASLNLSSYTITVGGDITINGTLDLDTGTLELGGTWTNTGTFTRDTGTVKLNGTSNQNVPVETFYNLTIDKGTSTALLASGNTVTVENNLVIDGGILELNGTSTVYMGNASLAGSVTVNSGGTFKTSGSTPTFTRSTTNTNRFSFTVNSGGEVDIDGLNFSYADSNGMNLISGSVITDLSNVAFTNAASGGNHLTIVFSGAFNQTFSGCSFDNTFGASGHNVSATGTGSQFIGFVPHGSAGGEGDAYEDENNCTIHWGAPYLDWTGEVGYVSDGVDPETGYSSTTFIYRIKYTNYENVVPSYIRVYIDRNGDGDYLDVGEVVDMNEDNPADTDYTDGKIYTYSTTIPYGPDTDNCSYYFVANDGTEDAIGRGSPAVPTQAADAINAPDVLQTLSVSVSPSSYNFGFVDAGTYVTSTSSITVTNDGDGDEDYKLQITSKPAGWTTVETASDPGNDEYKLLAMFNSTAPGNTFVGDAPAEGTDDIIFESSAKNCDSTNFSGDENGDDVAPSADRHLWLRFGAPASSTLLTQQSITITIEAFSSSEF